jgi:hypothetical protein
MGPPSYIWSVVDLNVVMQRTTVLHLQYEGIFRNVDLYSTTKGNIPKDLNIHQHQYEKPTSRRSVCPAVRPSACLSA